MCVGCSARVHCSAMCVAATQVRFSENIDFQAPMKAACESEIDTFCKRVPHENGRVIRWGGGRPVHQGHLEDGRQRVQRVA